MATILTPADRKADENKLDKPVHAVGATVGAVATAAAGATAGAFVGGPIGAAVGAAVGAVAGAIGGHTMAEGIDPTVEDEHWRSTYVARPYYRADYGYDDYGPAYRHAIATARLHGGRFEDAEAELERGWPEARGSSRLEWADAREPARDAWGRVIGGV